MNRQPKKILYLVSESSYFCSHRLALARFMQQQGFEVAVATRINSSNHSAEILESKLKLFALKKFARASWTNPFQEILALFELYKIYQNFQPDLVHHVALKAIIYGTIVARLLKIRKIINAFAGLGFVFTEFRLQKKYNPKSSKFIKNLKDRFQDQLILFKQKFFKFLIENFLRLLFKYPVRSGVKEIWLLQNNDDLKILYKLFKQHKSLIDFITIPGSGVEPIKELALRSKFFTLGHFHAAKPKVVLIARLLQTKGIYEFVMAARKIHMERKHTNLAIEPEFILYGEVDPQNPASIRKQDLEFWQVQGWITWKKFCTDVITAYLDCHIAVLPSYREGLPKTLLEAASCFRPIVTTDVPGCREIVVPGENGYLVQKQNIDQLATAILKLLEDPALMFKMGERSYAKFELEFSSEVIWPKFFALYNKI